MKNIVTKLLMGILLFSTSLAFAQTKSLSFATEATYPPFESLAPSGEMQGFDVDIIKALCNKMQTQCTFTNQAFDSLIPSLQLGKFDVIFGAINITDERAKQVDFTKPYYLNTVSMVAPKDKLLTLDATSLNGKTIGVQGGTTLSQYLQDTYGDKVKVNTYASEESAFLDLTSGRVDAVMGDTPLVDTWLKKNADKYALVGQPVTSEKYFGKGYGIAVKKGNVDLLNKLNTALAAIKADGTYDKIVKQYFSN